MCSDLLYSTVKINKSSNIRKTRRNKRTVRNKHNFKIKFKWFYGRYIFAKQEKKCSLCCLKVIVFAASINTKLFGVFSGPSKRARLQMSRILGTLVKLEGAWILNVLRERKRIRINFVSMLSELKGLDCLLSQLIGNLILFLCPLRIDNTTSQNKLLT